MSTMVADLLTKILPKPRALQFSAALLGNTTPSGLTRGTAHAAVLRGPASVGQPPQATKCLTPGPARHALPVRAQGH